MRRSTTPPPLDELPPEVEAWLRAKAERDHRAEQEIARMSPSEREARSEEALRKLRGSPGFIETDTRGGEGRGR